MAIHYNFNFFLVVVNSKQQKKTQNECQNITENALNEILQASLLSEWLK